MARTKQTGRIHSPEFVAWAEKETNKEWGDINQAERDKLWKEYSRRKETGGKAPRTPQTKRKKEKKKPLPNTKLFDRFLEVRNINRATANGMERPELLKDYNEWKASLEERRKTFPDGFLSWVTKKLSVSRLNYIQEYTLDDDKKFIAEFVKMKKDQEELVKLKEEKAQIIKPTVPLVRVNTDSNMDLKAWVEKGINVRRGTRGSNEYVVFIDNGKERRLYGPFF